MDHQDRTAPAGRVDAKITDKIAALPANATYLALEFFPPKTALGFSNLRDRLQRMGRALRPLFVTVTWGAGGSTAQKSLELAETCQRDLGLTTCLHLTCTNMSGRAVDHALDTARALGICNILALRGDAPREAEYRLPGDSGGDQDQGRDRDRDRDAEGDGNHSSKFVWAVDLIRHIRSRHGDHFCIGVAAYPEGHADESHPQQQRLEHDLPHLVDKVRAGADFIVTQLFFDADAYDRFERTLREHPSGAFATMPIIPGLMPIQSYQMIRRTTKLSHARMPDRLLSRLEAVRGDDEKVKAVGVDIVSELVEQVRRIKARTTPGGGPRGFHFYTLNLEKAVSFVAERAGLIPDASDGSDHDSGSGSSSSSNSISNSISNRISNSISNSNIDDQAATVIVVGGDGDDEDDDAAANRGPRPLRRPSRRSFASDMRNRVIVPDDTAAPSANPDYETTAREASLPVEPLSSRADTLAVSEGAGPLGREATWDDFPNGRWGDARSPAYREVDGYSYGVSLHVSAGRARELWPGPASAADVTDMFVRHVRGSLAVIPWSCGEEEELLPETGAIRHRLVALNSRGWWTVASQPAVNGARSGDATFGWGPPGGYVFQKAFVEFFLPAAEWQTLQARLVAAAAAGPDGNDGAEAGGGGRVSFYAANAAGEFASSDDTGGLLALGAAASANAVTWGVFPGREMVTPTIIEEVSFRTWSGEAFGIWAEWAGVYGRGSESSRLLRRIREDYWLVNVIHHDYMEADGLWEVLLGDSEGSSPGAGGSG